MASTTSQRYKGYLIYYAKGGGRQYPHWRVDNPAGRQEAACHTRGECKKWIDAHTRVANPLRRRKSRASWPKGKTPPHLKKYLFK